MTTPDSKPSGTEAESHARSWRNYIVSTRLQFIFGFLFPALIGQIYFVTGFAAARFLQFEVSGLQSLVSWPTIVFGILALLVFTFAWGTVMTFFLAGPLYAIKRHLEMYAAGKNPPPLKFRKYDEFKGLDDLVNACLVRSAKEPETKSSPAS